MVRDLAKIRVFTFPDRSVMMGLMTNDSLARLGRYVITRRQELGYLNRIDLARELEGELTDRTLADIENGDGRRSANTYAIVERALHWQPGSVEMILAGAEPVEKHRPQPVNDPAAAAVDVQSISSEILIAELRRRQALTQQMAGQFDEEGLRLLQLAETVGLTANPSMMTRGRREMMAITEERRAKREDEIAPLLDYAKTQPHL